MTVFWLSISLYCIMSLSIFSIVWYFVLYLVHVDIIIVCSLHWDFQYVLHCLFYLIVETYIDMYTRFIAFVLTVVCFPALTATRSLPGCDGAAEKFRGSRFDLALCGLRVISCESYFLGPFDPRNILSTFMTLFGMVSPSFSLIQTWLFDPHGWFLIGLQGKKKRLDSDAFKILNS